MSKNQQNYKRIASGLMAAQLLCAPLAQAAEITNVKLDSSAMYSHAEERLVGAIAAARPAKLSPESGKMPLLTKRKLPAAPSGSTPVYSYVDAVATLETGDISSVVAAEVSAPDGESNTNAPAEGELSTPDTDDVLPATTEDVSTPETGDETSPVDDVTTASDEGDDETPSTEGETTTPDEGGGETPSTEGETTTPDEGDDETPSGKAETTTPDEGDDETPSTEGETTTPDEGDDETPSSEEETTQPDEGGDETPSTEGETTTPDEGDDETPSGEEETTTPDEGDDETPSGEEETTTPDEGDDETPSGEEETTTPDEGGDEMPPAEGETPTPDDTGAETPPAEETPTPGPGQPLPLPEDDVVLPPEAEEGVAALLQTVALSGYNIKNIAAFGLDGYSSNPYYKQNVEKYYFVENAEAPGRNAVQTEFDYAVVDKQEGFDTVIVAGDMSATANWPWEWREEEDVEVWEIAFPKTSTFRIPDMTFLGWAVRLVVEDRSEFDDVLSGWYEVRGWDDKKSPYRYLLDGTLSNPAGEAGDLMFTKKIRWLADDEDSILEDLMGMVSPDESDGSGYYVLYFTALWELSQEARIISGDEKRPLSLVDQDGTPVPLYRDLSNEGNESDEKFYDKFSVLSTKPAENPVDGADYLENYKVDFDQDQEEYYIRIDADRDNLVFNFWTYEPGSKVDVTRTYGGVTYDVTTKINHTLELDPGMKAGTGAPAVSDKGADIIQNTDKNPARGLWEITIPGLERASGDNQYNDVKIVVTSPGGATKEYTFHIQKLNQPSMCYENGNMPAGVLKDDGKSVDNGFLQWEDGNRPSEKSPPALYKGKFSPEAWGDHGTNVDLTEEDAIVVYQDSKVTLPLLHLYDSRGVATSHNGTFYRQLALKTVDKFYTTAGPNKTTATVYYDGTDEDRLQDEPYWEVIKPLEKEILDLKNMNVVPGVYTLQYRYLDNITDLVYDRVGDGFLEKDRYRAENFERTLVVLPIPGDVDMDGHVTVADAVKLKELMVLKEQDPTSVDSLFWYRVCDVDGDGDVTADDLAALQLGEVLEVDKGFNGDYFYYPLPSAEPEPPRKDIPLTLPDSAKAHLSVKYLGKMDKNTGQLIPEDAEEEDKMLTKDDVFLAGLKLENIGAVTNVLGDMKAFSVTLTYDSDFLTPYAPTGGDLAQWIRQAGKWPEGVICNVLAADPGAATVAKAIPSLGIEGSEPTGNGQNGSLRELHVTIICTSAVSLAALEDGYLIQVPFKLRRHPFTAQVLEPVLGPRELAMAGTVATGAYSMADYIFGGATANLADYIDYVGAEDIPVGEDKTEITETFTIEYGSALPKTNLKSGGAALGKPEWLTYDTDDGANYYLKGEPRTTGTTTFYIGQHRYMVVVTKKPLELTLQPQVRYYGQANQDEVVFDYDVMQLAYWDREDLATDSSIEEKMHKLTAGPEAGGLAEYVAADFAYVETLAEDSPKVTIDTDANVGSATYYVTAWNGSFHDYEIHYVNADGTESETAVNTLTIKKRPILVNRVVDEGPIYTILANTETLRVPALSTDYLVGRNLPTEEEGVVTFDFVLPEMADGTYDGLALTGDAVHTKTINGAPVTDSLEIGYVLHYIADPGGVSGNYFPDMQTIEEERDVRVHSLRLQGTGNKNGNYVLVNALSDISSYGMEPVNKMATGSVLQSYVVELSFTHLNGGTVPNDASSESAMRYTHGDELRVSGLWVKIRKSDDDPTKEPTEIQYSNFHEGNISVFLAHKSEEGDFPTGERFPFNTKTDDVYYASRRDMNGMYIWVSVDAYDEDRQPVTLYRRSYYPLTIDQRPVTLTIAGEERYYGEENAEAVVTYTVSDLAIEDRDGMTGDFLTDFAGMNGYVAPQIKRVETLDIGATAITSSSWVGNYYVTIANAASTDYKFSYTYEGTNGTGTSVDLGYNMLHVYPRPIVVQKITAQPESIYADAAELKLIRQTASTSLGQVTLTLPVEGQTYYLQTGKATGENTYPVDGGSLIRLGLTNTPLFGNDRLAFTYTAEYQRDLLTGPPYFEWKENDDGVRSVNVSMVELTEAGNYVLVWPSTTNAMYGYPGVATTTNDDSGDRQTTGKIKLRSAASVVIVAAPEQKYTHGDSLALVRDSGANRPALEVQIAYPGEPVKTVTFTNVAEFNKKSLHLTWDDAWPKGQEILTNDDLVVTYANHNNRTLHVTLEQMGNLAPMEATTNLRVSVAKKELTLNVVSQNRYYGETNDDYKYTFDLSQLATIDRKLLGADAKGEGTAMTGSATLAAINAPYTKGNDELAFQNPTFKTEAAERSEAGHAYDLTLEGGFLINYSIIKTVPGTIRVFRRPILVQQIVEKKVVELSVTNKNLTVTKKMEVSDDSTSVALTRADAINGGASYTGRFANTADNYYKSALNETALPLNTAGALAAGDSVTLDFTATFPQEGRRPEIEEGEQGVECNVTVESIELDEASAKNYMLVYNQREQTAPVNPVASGWLTERVIQDIKLWYTPNLRFTYGDTLTAETLAGFRFAVNDGRGEATPTAPDQVGVEYEIYYWDGAWEIPTTQEDIAALKTEKAYYRARVGDALTIAPHRVDDNFAGVSHNGMYLLFVFMNSQSVSAEYLPPVITTAKIEVIPKELTYRLAVDDKPYDGNTVATGTLTLTNVLAGDVYAVGYDTDLIKFNFIQADVKYATQPQGYAYAGLEIVDIQVEVTGITLIGDMAPNYHINGSVLRNWSTNSNDYIPGRPTAAPTAKIHKIERAAPVLDNILLDTNIHTNTVTVNPNGTPTGSGIDAERFEYRLEYHAGGEDNATSWQDTGVFDIETMGLPRDTWYRGSVRFAETWNYWPTEGTLSAQGDLAQLSAEAQEAMDAIPTPDPMDPTTPAAPEPAPLTKTYTYRWRVFATTGRPGEDGSPAQTREIVTWFTDIGSYSTQEHLDWVLDNVNDKEDFFDYYWDETKQTMVTFPLDVSQPLTIEIERHNGQAYERQSVQVNENGNMAVYADGQKGITLWDAPSLTFDYGQTMTGETLAGFTFMVEDENEVNILPYDQVGVEYEIYYWDKSWPMPATQEEMTAMKQTHAADRVSVGDRLTIAPHTVDGVKGISHEGKYLLFLFKQGQREALYMPPVRSREQIKIIPKELTYTLVADDKDYDGNTVTSGVLTLNNVILDWDDDVAYDTNAIAFNFIDPNVRYATDPVGYAYAGLEIVDIPVEVTNIVLIGEHIANYHINSSVLRNWSTGSSEYVEGRPTAVPTAKIHKIERPAPALNNILLSTNIHTNAVTVEPNGTPVGSGIDAERYEYQLEYIVGGANSTTQWQAEALFDIEEMGLPRNTWYRGSVRFAETWNYWPTEGTLSVQGDLAQLAAAAQRNLDAIPEPDPKDPTSPAAPAPAKLTKTYTYRWSVYSAGEWKKSNPDPIVTHELATWFTDTEAYKKRENLDWTLDNVKDKRAYYVYYWDPTKTTALRFPLDISQPQELEIMQYTGVGYEKSTAYVNRDNNMVVYVAGRPMGGGVSMVEWLSVDPGAVNATLGDAPLQLSAYYEPSRAKGAMQWTSSNPNVVTVDLDGVLTFVGVGEATITVSALSGGLSATVPVTVKEADEGPDDGPGVEIDNDTFLKLDGLIGFMELDSEGKFRPEDTLTRGETALILAKLFRLPEEEWTSEESIDFPDVWIGDSYAEAVDLLSSHGIVKGVDNGDFEGERNITREEIVLMLARMLRLTPEDPVMSPVFLDGGSEDTWAAPYLKEMYREGIVQGVGEGYFAPKRDATRAEAASFISRAMLVRANLASEQLRIPVDVEAGYWAYENILRAVNDSEALVMEP